MWACKGIDTDALCHQFSFIRVHLTDTQHIEIQNWNSKFKFHFNFVNGKKMQMKATLLIDFYVLSRHSCGLTARWGNFRIVFHFSFYFSLSLYLFAFRKLAVCQKCNYRGHLTIVSIVFEWCYWIVYTWVLRLISTILGRYFTPQYEWIVGPTNLFIDSAHWSISNEKCNTTSVTHIHQNDR